MTDRPRLPGEPLRTYEELVAASRTVATLLGATSHVVAVEPDGSWHIAFEYDSQVCHKRGEDDRDEDAAREEEDTDA